MSSFETVRPARGARIPARKMVPPWGPGGSFLRSSMFPFWGPVLGPGQTALCLYFQGKPSPCSQFGYQNWYPKWEPGGGQLGSPGLTSPVPEAPCPGAVKIASIFLKKSHVHQSEERGPSPAPQPSSEELASEASEVMHR